jgi:16S rRNA (guanine966-N2)-methyltransferase
MPPTSKRRKSNSRAKPSPTAKQSRGLVRIIAGTHRGRRLPVLVHDGLRPTGDRVKETLFNWLMSDVGNSVCLDMYAGSGSLGIEALSRGAQKVVFIEQDKKIAQQISDNLITLRENEKAEVIYGNALEKLSSEHTFDLVFIDPPFGKNIVNNSLEKLIVGSHLSANAHIYIETAHTDEIDLPEQILVIKEIKTSQVFARLCKLK